MNGIKGERRITRTSMATESPSGGEVANAIRFRGDRIASDLPGSRGLSAAVGAATGGLREFMSRGLRWPIRVQVGSKLRSLHGAIHRVFDQNGDFCRNLVRVQPFPDMALAGLFPDLQIQLVGGLGAASREFALIASAEVNRFLNGGIDRHAAQTTTVVIACQ